MRYPAGRSRQASPACTLSALGAFVLHEVPGAPCPCFLPNSSWLSPPIPQIPFPGCSLPLFSVSSPSLSPISYLMPKVCWSRPSCLLLPQKEMSGLVDGSVGFRPANTSVLQHSSFGDAPHTSSSGSFQHVVVCAPDGSSLLPGRCSTFPCSCTMYCAKPTSPQCTLGHAICHV